VSLTNEKPAKPALHCSFCTKGSDQVGKLIAGPGVYICDACVHLCVGILDAAGAPSGPAGTGDPVLTEWESQSDAELLTALPKLALVSDQVDRRLHTLVDLLRSRGVAWSAIGEAFGVTRQSAWERFSG
jgi:hypothetical protein